MLRSSVALASALCVFAAQHAAAQTRPAGVPPESGRLTVSLNGGFQVSKQDVTRSSSFTIYDEAAQIDVTQNDIEGGGILDIGASYRFRNSLGAGVSFSFVRSVGDGTVTGSIPHPLLFDQPRSLSGTASDLEHKEQGIHVYATWLLPFTDTVDFTFSAGPSFYNISQDFIRNVTFSETPPFTGVTVDALETLSLKQNAIGFNLGVDATYRVTRMIGVGVLARFTRAQSEFELNDGDVADVKAGGFQLAGGIRVRF